MIALRTRGYPRQHASLLACALLVMASHTAAADNNTWTELGPDGGRIDQIMFDPNVDQRMYLQGFHGGVYRSDDDGASWQPVNPVLAEITVRSISGIAVSPVNSTLFTSDGGGEVARSLDGGDSWTVSSNGLSGAGVYDQFPDPVNAGVVYALATNRLFKSIDDGLNWTEVTGAMTLTVIEDIQINPADTQVLYATGWEGVYKSDDGGASWTQQTNGLPPPNGSGYIFAGSAAIDPLNPNIVYVMVSNDGLYKSMDGGAAWARVSTNLPSDFFTKLLVNPNDTDQLILATGNNDVIVSNDGGATWGDLVNIGLGDYTVQDMAFDPDNPIRLFAGVFLRGVYVTNDGAFSWTESSAGFRNQTVESVAYDRINQRIYTGTSGGTSVSSDEGLSWAQNVGDYDLASYAVAPDPLVPDHVYAGSSCCGLYESFDAGINWSRIDLQIPSVVATWVTDIDIPSGDTQVLLFSDFNRGLFRTQNGGLTWSQISTGLEPFFGGAVSLNSVDAVASQPDVIYAATNSFSDPGVFRSSDAGTTWEKKSSARADAIAAHPTNPDIVITANAGTLQLSDDGGATWYEPPTAPTGAGDVTDLYIDEADPTLMYAVKEKSNLYRSIDSGLTWMAALEAPPVDTLFATELAVDPSRPSQVLMGVRDRGLLSYTFATDLQLMASSDATDLQLGQSASITVDLANAGPTPASQVSVQASLPRQLSWVSASGDDALCTIVGAELTCTVDPQLVSDSTSLTLQVTALADNAESFAIMVQAREVELSPADNTASVELAMSAADGDSDGVADNADNCLSVPNPDQSDADADGIGTACDTDLDNDCQINFNDLAALKLVFFSTDANADFDQDGTVNFSDLSILKAQFFATPGPSGVPNICDI